jgi:hypothetical protein
VKSRVEANYWAIAGKLRRTQERKRGIRIDQSGRTGRVFSEALFPTVPGVAGINFSTRRRSAGFMKPPGSSGPEVRANVVTNNPDVLFQRHVHRYQNFFRPTRGIGDAVTGGFDAGTRPRALPCSGARQLFQPGRALAIPRRPRIERRRWCNYEIFPRLSVPLQLAPFRRDSDWPAPCVQGAESPTRGARRTHGVSNPWRITASLRWRPSSSASSAQGARYKRHPGRRNLPLPQRRPTCRDYPFR